MWKEVGPFIVYSGVVLAAGAAVGWWALVAGLPLLLVAYRSAALSVGFEVRYFGEILACGIIGRLAVVTIAVALVADVNVAVVVLWVVVEAAAISALFAPTLGVKVVGFACVAALALTGEWWVFYWVDDQYAQVLRRFAGDWAYLVAMAIVMSFDVVRNLGQFWLACWLKKEERDAR